jgi:hypothetical protein
LALVLVALLALIAMVASDVRGGPLDPSGSPGSTPGVRLPGTPISGPTTISQAGHYYLTNDITTPGSQTAITITADHVSLDLGGFHVVGIPVQNMVPGIAVADGANHAHIRNGSVEGYSVGISAGLSGYSLIEDVAVSLSSSRGIVVGPSSVLEDCRVYTSQGEGIVIEGDNSVVRACTSAYNVLNGVFMIGSTNVLEDSQLINNGSTADTANVRLLSDSNVVRDNTLVDVGASIYITGAHNNILQNGGECTVTVKDLTSTTVYLDNLCFSVIP